MGHASPRRPPPPLCLLPPQVEDRRKLLDLLRRRKKRDDFRALLADRHRAWLAQRDARAAIQAEDIPGEVTVIEQVVEIELEERVETVA